MLRIVDNANVQLSILECDFNLEFVKLERIYNVSYSHSFVPFCSFDRYQDSTVKIAVELIQCYLVRLVCRSKAAVFSITVRATFAQCSYDS